MNIKNLFSKKRIIWTGIILVILIASYFLFFNKKNTQQTLTVHPGDFLQQVSASGTVVAKQNLDLSFAQTDQVSGVYVNVGDHVAQGKLLASQNTAELQAQLSQMRSGTDLEQAKLNQLLAGSSPQDIQTAQDSVTAAQQTLSNAYASALTALESAYGSIYQAYTTVTFIKNTYFTQSDPEGIIVQEQKDAISNSLDDAKKYIDTAQAAANDTNATDTDTDTDTAISRLISDATTTYDSVTVIREQCENGVYYSKVSAGDKTSLDTQKTSTNTAISNLTVIQSTIASDTLALVHANDELAAQKAPARASDIAVFQAQIDQAKASEENVVAQIGKKRIYSPIQGVVTAVNAKVGSVFSANDVAISVISANNFQIESYVPEINISYLAVGQDATATLDAYGDTVFNTKVISIDPAETIKDGVSTYKVTLAFADNNDPRIKSGMTGTVIVTTLKKSNVIAVPQGIVTMENGQKFVEVKTGDKTVSQKVETGSVASNGTIEITSGLKDGDVVILQ
jgi:HlyD family secretion protein